MRCIRAQRGKRGPRGGAHNKERRNQITPAFQIYLFVRLLKGGARWVELRVETTFSPPFPFQTEGRRREQAFVLRQPQLQYQGQRLQTAVQAVVLQEGRRGGQLAAVAATLFGRFPLRLRIQDGRDGVGTTPPSPWPAHSSTRRSCMARYSSWNN